MHTLGFGMYARVYYLITRAELLIHSTSPVHSTAQPYRQNQHKKLVLKCFKPFFQISSEQHSVKFFTRLSIISKHLERCINWYIRTDREQIHRDTRPPNWKGISIHFQCGCLVSRCINLSTKRPADDQTDRHKITKAPQKTGRRDRWTYYTVIHGKRM